MQTGSSTCSFEDPFEGFGLALAGLGLEQREAGTL